MRHAPPLTSEKLIAVAVNAAPALTSDQARRLAIALPPVARTVAPVVRMKAA